MIVFGAGILGLPIKTNQNGRPPTETEQKGVEMYYLHMKCYNETLLAVLIAGGHQHFKC